MERKYRLCAKEHLYGRTLYRVQAVRDFILNDGERIDTGEVGGLVDSEANLSQEGNCWITKGAKVLGDAYVCGDAVIRGGATVWGRNVVCGFATICGDAMVAGWAIVKDRATVKDHSCVTGGAIVGGTTLVQDYDRVNK